MNEIRAVSKYEEIVIKILMKKGIKFKQNPTIEGCNYRPDFIVENLNGSQYIIEVKSRILDMSKIITNLVDARDKISGNDINYKVLLIVFEKVSSFFEDKCKQEGIEIWDIEEIEKINKETLPNEKAVKPKTKTTKKIEMDVLENSLDFIVKSFEEMKTSKSLKYALLNFTSGMELLFKAILLNVHWSLTVENVDKIKEQSYENRDFMSVNWDNSIQRLKVFCEIDFKGVETDLKNLKQLRNKIEHYDCNFNPNSIIMLINKLTNFLVNLLVNNFDTKKFRKKGKELFEDIQSSLFESEEQYENAKRLAEKKLKDENKRAIDIVCKVCKEKFVTEEKGYYLCNLCKQELTAEDIASSFIENELKIDEITEEDDNFPQHNCPECLQYSFVYHYKANGEKIAHCYSCKGDYPNAKRCDRCKEFFNPIKEDEFLCERCYKETHIE
ncbi:MAG: hypothetical protein HFJ32_00285 [Clostridia bacterium]|nr:hypothetical protein [Clostridia bacterium]